MWLSKHQRIKVEMILHDSSWASRANNPSPFVDGSWKRGQHLWFWLLTKRDLKIGAVVMYVNEQRGFSLTKESKIKENGEGRESKTDRELLVGRCLIQNFKTRLTRRNFSVRGSIQYMVGRDCSSSSDSVRDAWIPLPFKVQTKDASEYSRPSMWSCANPIAASTSLSDHPFTTSYLSRRRPRPPRLEW